MTETRTTQSKSQANASSTPKEPLLAKSGRSTRNRIVAAAKELFLKNGFSRTSLEVVAAEAGVTKPTVYSHFRSKRDVLLAVTETLQEQAEQITLPLHPTGNIAEDLRRFGRAFVRQVMTNDAQAWHRLAVAEAVDHPEVGQAVFDAGPAKVIRAVEAFLQHEVRQQRLTCPDPAIAAEQLLGLLHGIHPIRMATGQKTPSKAKQRRFADAAVDTFLKAFGN